MKPSTWYFVSDHDGMELAAFPERDLAEAYMEDMPWEIDAKIITTLKQSHQCDLARRANVGASLRRAEETIKQLRADNAALRAALEACLPFIESVNPDCARGTDNTDEERDVLADKARAALDGAGKGTP